MVSKGPNDEVGTHTEFCCFGFGSGRHKCPGFGYNLCQTFGVSTHFPKVSSHSRCWRANGRTSDPDNARPISPDFVPVHRLVVIRHWMVDAENYNSDIISIRFARKTSPDVVERICLWILSASIGFFDEEACALSRS